MQEWYKPDFKGADEAEVEDEMDEVMDSWYAIITKGQDIMPMIVWTQHVHHVCIVACLIMRWKIVLHW